MEVSLGSAALPVKMVSTTALNGCNDGLQATCRPTILLHDSLKKGNEKSEETVHIPTSMVLASATESDLKQQQAQYHQKAAIFATSGRKSCSRVHINRTECTSAVTESVSSSEKDFHVVKIQISPNFKSSSSKQNKSSSISAAIVNNTVDTGSIDSTGARSVDQLLGEPANAALQPAQSLGTQAAKIGEQSLKTSLECGFHARQTSATDLSATSKSDISSDLSAVQNHRKIPKVSTVSFIADSHENTVSNGKDQCEISMKSDCHKKNISQTFLASSSDEDSFSLTNAVLAASEPVTLTIPSTRSALSSSAQEQLLDSSLNCGAKLVSTRSSVPTVTSPKVPIPLSDSELGVEISASSVPAISLDQLALPVRSAKGDEFASDRKVSEVLSGRVSVDTLDTSSGNNTSNEMVQKPSGDLEVSNPTYLYYMMTSGQCSPSDTLDSGTCSDMENGGGNHNSSGSVTPPPLPKKMGPKLKMMHLKTGSIICEDSSSDEPGEVPNQVTNGHTRTASFTDSEESECSLSCDSLNSSEFARSVNSIPTPPRPPMLSAQDTIAAAISMLPDSLLRDIRDRKFASSNKDTVPEVISASFKKGLQTVDEHARDRNKSCVLIRQDGVSGHVVPQYKFESDKFYKFHINEKDIVDELVASEPRICRDDETFAGYKDIHSGTSTIRSSKGTVRGVKNRVRNGIATFLQMQQTNVKNYKEKDAGKVVLYTTSMGIIRETYAKCANVKQILRTLLIKFEERDVFMSCDYQQEIKDRMQMDEIQVPQLFVEGQYIGDAATVERLNESGELRQMLKPYKSMTSSYTCQVCGGYRLLPCSSCNGSKKSVHRNHFTTEFVALKCMNCDEVGLVKCHNC